jgi:hypothetical protein
MLQNDLSGSFTSSSGIAIQSGGSGGSTGIISFSFSSGGAVMFPTE